VFGERRWLTAVPVGCVILVTKLGGKIEGVCGRVVLRGAANCEFLGLIKGAGVRVSRTERERRPGRSCCRGGRCRSVTRRSVGFLASIIIIVFHMGEVCLNDEIDRGRGNDVNRSRDGLGLLGRCTWRRRIAGSVEGRIVTRTDKIRGPRRRDHSLLAVVDLWVRGGVKLVLSNMLVVRSVRLVVSPRGPAKSEVAGREVTSRGALKRRRVMDL